MVQAYVVTPYPPEMWSEENVDKYGEPTSSLEVKESELSKVSKPNWRFDRSCLYVDGELSFMFSIFDKHVLRIELFMGHDLSQFIYQYRAIVPKEYDLYLFKEGYNTYLKLTLQTTVDEITNWTGYS
jgi:hypothetical protein